MYRDARNAEDELRGHLDSNEKLIWVGVPKQGLTLRGSDALLIPFSLLWGGFAVFWELSVVNMNAPFFFKLFGVPFVFIGLYFIVGRFFFDAHRRKKTNYGMTENRILIKSGIFSSSIQSLNIKTLSNITLTEKADGSGTIVLGPEMAFSGIFRGTGWPGAGSKMAPALEMIPDVRTVYRQITDLQKAS